VTYFGRASWKDVCETSHRPDFLRFFIPNADEIFDFTKDVEFLDKELAKLFPEAKNKNRRADKLAKVFMKDGTEKWILAHVEIQGYVDDEFGFRMFQYYYRIRDKYNQPVMAFAVLTDDSPNYRPTEFSEGFLDTKLLYQYKTLKLSDYRPEDFQKTNNIFAFALEVAWYGLKANKPKEGETLYQLKMNLFRRVQKKGYSANDFRQILKFLKNYVSFGNEEMLIKFEEETDKPVKNMGIVEAVETYYKEYGIKQGKKEGRKIGKIEGKIEERVSTVVKLYSRGFEINQIADILELTAEEVQQILKAKSLI
jgi:predicted transposase YdaD